MTQGLGDLGQWVVRAQHLAAHQMGGQIAITEAEPIRLHAIGGQFLFGMPGFVAVSPAPVGINAAAQGVHAGVQVRADAHAEHPGVITDVDHRGQLVLAVGGGAG